MANAPRDANAVTTLMGVDILDLTTPTLLAVDAITNRLLVQLPSGGSGLTDTELRATPISVTGGGGGTEYTEDAAAVANPVGTSLILVRQDTPGALVTTDGDNVAQRGTNYGAGYSQIVTSAGAFVDTFGGGQQYADGAVRGTSTGTVAMGDDGTNIQSLKVDSAGELQVDVLTLPAVTGTVTANIGTAGTLATAANQLADGHNVVVTSAPSTAVTNAGITTIAGAVAGTEMQVDVLTMPTTAVTGTFFQATQPVSGTVTANAGTNLNTSTLALEAGGNLASVKTNTDKIPSQGQALAAASTPVVLTAAQVTTLTPPAAITGFATSALQSTQDTSINTLLKPASTLTAVSTVTNLSQQGGVAIALNTGTRSAGTQRVTIATDDLVPVTGTVTANAGTGTLAVSLASVPSHAVTNAGTFATQATLQSPTTIANGRKVVTTAGTAVVLAASTPCTKVDITAETDNTGIISVGGSGVIALLATRQGVPLNAGDTYSLDITNLTTVYIDSTVSGDGVTFSFQT